MESSLVQPISHVYISLSITDNNQMDFRMTLVCFCGSAVICPFGYWTIYRQKVGLLIKIEN